MAFSKAVVEDKIEVLELGQIQVRTKTTVLEDSVELSSSFHRHVVVPCTYNGSAWVDTDTSGNVCSSTSIGNSNLDRCNCGGL